MKRKPPGLAVTKAPSGAGIDMQELLSRPAAAALALGKEEFHEAPQEILWLRDLSEVEAKSLRSYMPTRRPSSHVEILRAKHHTIARMLVAGMKPAEIARDIGCSALTIRTLQDSPAFMALYMEYSAMADEKAVDLRARMQAAAGLGVEEITRRLAEAPEQLPMRDLRDTTTMLLDRVGHGPTTKVESISAVLTADEIRAMRSASKRQIVEHEE